LQLHMGPKINWIFIFTNHNWAACILNALFFIFLRVYFKNMCNFVNLLLKLNIYVLSSRFSKIRYLENDYFVSNLLKIKIFCLLVFGGIVVKTDNFHLFEKILKFLFHANEAMGNEIYEQYDFFLTCTCVLMLLCIYNGFGNNDTSQEIYMFTNHSISSFVFTPYIGSFFIHKSPRSCSFSLFWNPVMKKIQKYTKKDNDILW
jgi:hypothetical protein